MRLPGKMTPVLVKRENAWFTQSWTLTRYLSSNVSIEGDTFLSAQLFGNLNSMQCHYRGSRGLRHHESQICLFPSKLLSCVLARVRSRALRKGARSCYISYAMWNHVEPEILCIIAKSWREHVMVSRQMGLMQLTDTLVSHKYLKFHFLLKCKWVKKKNTEKKHALVDWVFWGLELFLYWFTLLLLKGMCIMYNSFFKRMHFEMNTRHHWWTFHSLYLELMANQVL